MVNRSPQPSPFVPGSGRLPPYLAGREAPRHALRDLLAYLRVGEGAPADAVLSGPRGNGKTSLLHWFQQEIESASPPIDTVWMTPSGVRDLDALARQLAPRRRFWAMRPTQLTLSLGFGKAGWRAANRDDALAPLLVARCRRRPLVVLVDEAHTLDLTVGQALLNASQTVRRSSPFLLVMAGTPGLQHHLNTMAATFWSRSEKLGIGRLEDEAAAAALVRPLASETPSVSFDGDALAQVLEASQGYPYFLQLWGRELWRAKGDALRIDQTLVQAARGAVEASKTAYYEDRREELVRLDLHGVASTVAQAFTARASVPGRELDAAIVSALADGASHADVLRCQDALADTGYVWKPPAAGDAWEPGIPSLMDYIQEHPA